MKAAKSHKDMQFPEAAFLAALPWSTLDAWHRKPRASDPAQAIQVPLTPEEHYRLIELALQHQAARRRVTPESDLRDWLDAEEEVKSH